MEVPQPDPEQTERLLFLSDQADDKFSTTINDFYASVRQQCQTTVALHVHATADSFRFMAPSETNQLVVASQEANTNLEDRMRALCQCFEEQKDAKAKASSALATQHDFFRNSNAILLKESRELIAHDNELQEMHRTTHSECEDLKKRVANLESERTNLLGRATTAEKQQSLLQVHIDHKTRQYNQRQTSALGLEGQVRQLERSLVIDRTKLEDEKRRSAELQTSIGQLQLNVETLEKALSQSNDCLKVHVAHVDTQQTTNDGLKRQVQELESFLESARRELDGNKREITGQQDVVKGLDSRMQELEKLLQSTKDCLENEKSLSNAGQASTAALTTKVHQLENSLNETHQKLLDDIGRHGAQEQNLERSLDLSNNSLEAYMDRCKSQQVSIDTLSQEAKHLESSLEVARNALEDERQQSAVRQASVEELRSTANQLEASLHLASDYLQDEKNRCNMHQASIASLTAKVCNLEQSLRLAHMDLEKHKLDNQNSIASMEAYVHKLEKTLELTRSDLGEKRARCVAQAGSIVGLNDKIRASRGDLTQSQQRCNAQQLSIISLSNVKQELEKSLQASRDDVKAKAQLYCSQQPYIDSLKETERELRRSLQSSQTETRAEKDHCTAQQSLVTEMERNLQELKVELELTRGRLKRAEQLCDTRAYSVSDLNLDAQQLEDGVERNSTEMDPADEDTIPDGTSTRQLAQASGEGSGLETAAFMQQGLQETTETPQTHERVAKELEERSPDGELSSKTPDLSEPSRRSDILSCPPLLESEKTYNLMVIRTILRHLSPFDGLDVKLVSENGSDSKSGDEATGVPSRFLGIRYTQSSTDGGHYQVNDISDDEGQSCLGHCMKRIGDKVCHAGKQSSELYEIVGREAAKLHNGYSTPESLERPSRTTRPNHKSPEWLRSTTRADYPGASDEKTLAGLSLIEQHLQSFLRVCRSPHAPKTGFRVLKERVLLYRSKWYQAASAKDGSTFEDKPPMANTARKRHNNDDLEVDTQRQTKRNTGTTAADAPNASTGSDINRRHSGLAEETETEGQGHVLDSRKNVQKISSTHDSHMPKKLAHLEQIRRSPWARDTSEGARHFIESLTPALCVNVLCRLAELSRDFPVQQVVLHINLEQLSSMGGKLEGSPIIPPVVESGFTITEKHICSYPELSFDNVRLGKLLKYRLDSARFGPALGGKTLGLKPSGLFTLVSRQDPSTSANRLRKRFDAETIATIRAAATTRVATKETHENERATRPSGGLPKHAPDHHAPDAQAGMNLGVQHDGRFTSPTRQAPSNQPDRLRGQIKTAMTPIAV